MKKLLIIGSSGQLAHSFRSLSPEALFLDRGAIDLAFPDKVSEALERHNPFALINAAAYTQVDNAESEERLAHAINAQSPAAMAIYCSTKRIPFVHFSTEYVFDGSGSRPWKEDDAPAPLNAYGRSKLAGEDAIARIGGSYLVLRTSWLYDARGRNFANTILRHAGEREMLNVVDDQFGAPTYAPHLAFAALALLEKAMDAKRFPSGIYHLANAGETSWHGFAGAILSHAQKMGLRVKTRTLNPIASSAYPMIAKRPANSRLDCGKALSMFGVALPSWQEGLAACMETKREHGGLAV